MVEFIFTTNSSSSTTYDGPSGFRYVIFGIKPFRVDNSEDIAFFRNKKQFQEVGIIEKILPKEPEKTKEELFEEEVNSLKIKKDTKKEILKAYLNRKDFIDDLEEGYQIGPKVSKKDIKTIKSHFLKEEKVIKKPKKFDSIETIKKNIKKVRKKR